MTASTLVGVGNDARDVIPTLAAVVAELTAWVAARMRAASAAAVEPVVDDEVPPVVAGGEATWLRGAPGVGVTGWGGRPGVVGGCRARPPATATTATSRRPATTAVALKTRLRLLGL